MLIAYNNDIEFRSRWYHIQTEDNGIKDGHITTTVFFSGQILDSKTTSYLDAIAGIGSEEEQNRIIKDAMTAQHKYFYTKLYEGAYEAHINAAHKSPTPGSGSVKSSPQIQPATSASQLGSRTGVGTFHSDPSLPSSSRLGKPDILRASQQLPVANKNLSSLSSLQPQGIVKKIQSSHMSLIHSSSHINNNNRQPVLKHTLPRSKAAELKFMQAKHKAWRGVQWPLDDLGIDVLVAKLILGEET